MKFKYINYIVFALFFCSSSGLSAQQDMSMYQFRGLMQASYMNPAFSGNHKVSIGLPGLSSLYLSYNNNAFDGRDLFNSSYDLSLSSLLNPSEEDGSLLNYLNNPAAITSKLAEKNYLMTNIQADLFHFQYNTGKHSFGFNVTQKVSGMVIFPKSLFELIQNGNGGANLGKPLSVNGLGPDFNHYREYGLSYSQIVNDKIQVGARLKLLSGFQNVSFNNTQLTWTTDTLDYSWDVEGAFSLNSSGVIGVEDMFSVSNLINGAGNRGFGLDLGISYNLTDDLNLSASVSDLGFINWSNNLRSLSTDNFEFSFDGIDVFSTNDSTSLSDLLSNTQDEILDSVNPVEDSLTNYTTRLHPRVMLGGNYSISEKLNLGLLLHGQFYGPATKYGASVSARYQIFNSLSAMANYTVTDKTFNNVGHGLMFDAGPVQVYAMTDNILGLNISNTRNLHARAGVNIKFGKRNPDPKDTEMDDMPRGEVVSNIETPDTTAAEPTVEPPSFEPIEVVKPSYDLFCEVVDSESGLELTGIIVEVYKKEIGSGEKQSSNRPYNSGQFIKQLDRSLTHRIVVKKAGYEDSELMVFPDDIGDKPELREMIIMTPKVLQEIEEPVFEEEEEVPVMSTNAYELTSRTSLRSEATSSSAVIERVAVGTVMEVIEETNKYWWRVNINGQEGYIKAAYLTPSAEGAMNYSSSSSSVEEDSSGTGTYYFLIEKTSLRSGATSSSEVVLRFRAGDEVELIDKTTKYWWKVNFKGKTGYVKAAKLEE